MGIPAYAVFEGGGVKGIGFVGALEVAEKRGFEWQEVAGTSAGAMVAALVAGGYRSKELHTLMSTTINFEELKDKGWEDYVPTALGQLFSVMKDNGVYEGKKIIQLMDRLLSEKLNKDRVTFKDLPIPLRVIVSDVTNRRLLVLPDDLKNFGMDPGVFPVAEAVRASVSIPVFYEPYVLKYHTKGEPDFAVLVDGGLLSNFPIWLYEPPEGKLKTPTIGFLLREPNMGQRSRIDGPITYLLAVLSTAMEAHDAYTVSRQNYAQTIEIPTGEVKLTDFELTPQEKDDLYRNGLHAAEALFESQEFTDWLKQFPEVPQDR